MPAARSEAIARGAVPAQVSRSATTGMAWMPSSPWARNYLSNAIRKVGAGSRLDAIRIARDAGWL
jgi:hypothetical protein